MVWNNKLYWFKDGEIESVGQAPRLASPLLRGFAHRVTHWLETGFLTLPNAIFVINAEDNLPRWCGPARKPCEIPILSFGKTINEQGADSDILIPQLFFGGNTFYSLPWHLKRDQAYFRGIPFCSGIWKQTVPGCAVACPRTFYAWRSDLDARTNRTPSYLDVGIVEPPHMPWVNDTNEKQGYINCNPDALPVFERTAMSRHAKYKYLLHLEGIAYSSRLSQLMLTNSLVLFQRQPFLEWFYRSLRPGVHYVPFWNATIFANNGSLLDVYDIIDDLRRRDEKDPRDLQRMITAANNFAMKFTTATGRARYLREALTAYRALFIDMDPYLEQFVAGLKAQGKWKEAKDSSVDH